MAYEREIVELIDRYKDEIGELLIKLISYPSLVGQEDEIIGYLFDRFKALQVDVESIPYPDDLMEDEDYVHYDGERPLSQRKNLVITRKGGEEGRSVILQAHTDIVPAKDWKDAFKGRRDGDIIYGRGACDDKGEVALIYIIFKILDELDIELKGDLFAQIVTEEEVGGNGALALIKQGYRAEGVVILEGSDLQIQPANRGAIWFQIWVGGKSVHMGRIEEGVSAIDKAIQIIDIFRRYEKRLIEESKGYPLFERYERPVQMNIGIFNAGDWPSTVPGEVTMEGGIGFLPNKSMSQIKQDLIEAIESEGDEWLKSHYKIEFNKLRNDSYELSPTHPLVITLKNSCDMARLDSEVFGLNVSCDARLYAKRANLPTLVFGPGDIADAHSDSEHISLVDIQKAAKGLLIFLMNWCGVED